jgi:hypothetical protein
MSVTDRARQIQMQEEFLGRLAQRLERGRQEYGDASLQRPIDELRGEIEEELLDVAGWAFVPWLRGRALPEADP